MIKLSRLICGLERILIPVQVEFKLLAAAGEFHGSNIFVRVLDHCRHSIVTNEILQSVFMLSEDQYGNFVIQHLLENRKPHERSATINQLIGKTVQMSQQKFSSIVILKCLSFGTPEERQRVVNEILGSRDEHEPLQEMLENKFALYVLQKVLETCDDQKLRLILDRVKVHLNALRKHTYGIHSVARIDKLVAARDNISSFSHCTRAFDKITSEMKLPYSYSSSI